MKLKSSLSEGQGSIGKVQHRFARLFQELRSLSYIDRLKKLQLWTLEGRGNRADLIEQYKMLRGITSRQWTSLLYVYVYVFGSTSETIHCGHIGICLRSLFHYVYVYSHCLLSMFRGHSWKLVSLALIVALALMQDSKTEHWTVHTAGELNDMVLPVNLPDLFWSPG